MPAGKPRRKDDTWTTEDLTHALKGAKDGGDKKKRSRDDDGKERRKGKGDVNGDDKKSSRKKDDEDRRGKGHSRGDFSPTRVDLTEEERERLRQERREKRGGDSKKKEDRPRKEEKEAEERPKREESARRHRKRDDEDDGDKKRRHADDDGDRKREKDSKHRDKEDEDDEEKERRRRERRERRDKKDEDGDPKQDDDDERERRRRERREKKEEDGEKDRKHRSKRDHDNDEEKEKKHRDREERHRDKEERHKDSDKSRDREKEREERRKDREERHKDKDKDRESREERKRREREEEEQRQREEEEEKRKKADKAGGDDDDYNDYDDDDFEDYEDDFENDEMNEGRRRRKRKAKAEGQEGEMEEVLRALDEENARLTSLSHRSNWSDSTELSDERFKEGEGPGHQEGVGGGGDSRPPRPKTFINFVSAKQRVMNQSQASKARRRADDLKNMIELDTVYYDLFDLPPVREYDLYIRSFGRSNTKQAYVQTNEDAVERDIQTEEMEDMDKWTQHPAEDMGSVGGDGITLKSGEEEKTSSLSNAETSGRVGKFLERAAQVMVVLMEEEKNVEEGGGQARGRSSISVSEGVSQLGCPPYLAGRQVNQVCFCPLQPNTFLTLHSRPQENAPESVMSGYGIVCVWNVKETASPQKVLTSLSQPTCACFSPSRAALVIAGMHDGSVMVWDLRESSALHRSVFVDDQEITTRFPTYNTAGVLDKENHHSPVTAITAVHPAVLRKNPEENVPAEVEGSLSFQLASVEEGATVILWVVTEISSPDMAGSEVDLGLAPGGRVKLLRSSAIVLDNPNKLVSSRTLKALGIQLSPSDLNHFFVATDLGQIIHGVRFGSRVFPRAYHPEIDAPKQITCLDFSPFGEPYFLTGCEDGSVHLYHTSQKHPLSSWSLFSEGHAILSVQWSRSRPAVFLVLADNSTLHTFDLVETGLLPVKSDSIASGRITAMGMGSDPALIGGNKSLPAHLLVALDSGSTELHTVSSTLRQQQPLECEFLAHYSDRF